MLASKATMFTVACQPYQLQWHASFIKLWWSNVIIQVLNCKFSIIMVASVIL